MDRLVNFKHALVLLSLFGTIACADQTAIIPEVGIANQSGISQFSYAIDSVVPALTITQRQIQQSGAKTLGQILSFSGLQQQELDGSNLSISMRGFGRNTAQNTLILLNGHPLAYADLGTFDFNQIAVNRIKKIEIYTNSMAVLYGNQAVGGVINIITMGKIDNTKTINLGAGSYNGYQFSANLNQRINDHFGVNFGLLGESNDQYREHNRNKQTSALIGLDKKATHSELHLQYQVYHQNLLYPGALTASQLAENRRQTQNSSDFFAEDIQNFQAHTQWQFSNDWQFNISSLLHKMKGRGILTNSFTNNRDTSDITPTVSGMFAIGTVNVTTKSGVVLFKSDYDFNSLTYNSKAKQSIFAGFGQISVPTSSNWRIVGGLRYATADSNQAIGATSTEANDHAFVSQVGVLWQPLINLNIYLRRAGNYRFPKTDENIDTNTGKPLKTQTGVSYESGFSLREKQWQGLFQLYHLQLENEITSIPIPNSQTSFALNQNLPETERNGFSVNISYQPSTVLTLQAIYHYVDAKFSAGPDKGNDIPFVADQTAVFTGVYDLTQHWRLSLINNITGPRRLDDDPEQRSPKLNAVYTLDGSVQYHRSYWQVNLRVNNMFNTDYNEYAFDVYNGSETTSYYYPAPGINFWLSSTVDLT